MSRTEGPRVVQRFSDEYIERCRDLSPRDIVRFLEDYRKLFGAAKRQRGQRAHRETESRESTLKCSDWGANGGPDGTRTRDLRRDRPAF